MDEDNGNTLWTYDISKDIKDVRPSFSKLDNGEIITIVYQRVNCHIIFDVNMEYLRRKSRLVAGEYTTDPPATITHTSVASR